MKKRIKKIFATLLVFCMAISLLPISVSAAITGTHVGIFSKDCSNPVPFEFSVVPISIYNTKDSQKIIDNLEVAYCFNHDYAGPKNDVYGNWNGYNDNYNLSANTGYNYYTKTAKADAATLKANTIYKDMDEDYLYRGIISVGLNGYPNDYSGFNQTIGLTDAQFNVVTQRAVWHFTDGYSRDNLIYGLNDAQIKMLDLLIGQILPDSVIAQAGGVIDLYTTNDVLTLDYGTYKKQQNYQNLLVMKSNPTIPAKRTLTLSKSVDAQNVNASQTFTFTIKLNSADGSAQTDHWFNYSNGVSISKDEGGEITVSLVNGAWVEIELPDENYSYTITESSTTGYKVDGVNVDGQAVTVNGSTVSATNVTKSDTAVSYVNVESTQTEETTKPAETTTKPQETTTKPAETTTKPTETTTKQEETTTKPAETTTKLEETTTKQEKATTKQEETTTKPEETTTKLEETTTKLEETTSALDKETTVIVDELTSDENESTSTSTTTTAKTTKTATTTTQKKDSSKKSPQTGNELQIAVAFAILFVGGLMLAISFISKRRQIH